MGLPLADAAPAVAAEAVPPPPSAAKAAPAKAVDARRVVYTASLGVYVANAPSGIREVERLAVEAGGFVQSSSLTQITVRVPPDRFQDLLTSVEQLGEVFNRSVLADDVTNQFTDIDTRLDVAERTRQRLMTLLESAKEAKDMLEIEREIRRVTEEIEALKGSRRVLDDRASWATVEVAVHTRSAVAEPAVVRTSPFPWVHSVGINQTIPGARRQATGSRMGLAGPAFVLGKSTPAPEGFVMLWRTRDVLQAATAEDYRLRAVRLDLRMEGTLDFWADTLAQDLARVRGYRIEERGSVEMLDRGLAGRHLAATVTYGGEQWAWDVWLVAEGEGADDELYVVEYARLAKDRARHAEAVRAAVEGMRTRRYFGF